MTIRSCYGDKRKYRDLKIIHSRIIGQINYYESSNSISFYSTLRKLILTTTGARDLQRSRIYFIPTQVIFDQYLPILYLTRNVGCK